MYAFDEEHCSRYVTEDDDILILDEAVLESTEEKVEDEAEDEGEEEKQQEECMMMRTVP